MPAGFLVHIIIGSGELGIESSNKKQFIYLSVVWCC